MQRKQYRYTIFNKLQKNHEFMLTNHELKINMQINYWKTYSR